MVGADVEGLRKTLRFRLLGVGQIQPPFAAVAEKPAKAWVVFGGGDDQDVPDSGQHQH